MSPKLTFADLIEDHTGIALAPASMHFFDKMNNDDLGRLGNYVHERSSELLLDETSNSSAHDYFVFPRNGSTTPLLGGARRGSQSSRSPEYKTISANLFSVLLYYPRVAVYDGIEYYLDYFRLGYMSNRTYHLKPWYKQNVVNILKFYCDSRELIRSGALLVIPRGMQDYRKDLVNLPFIDHIYPTIRERLEYYDEDRSLYSINDVIWDTNDLWYLMSLCGRFNLNPVLDTRYYQIMFESLSKSLELEINAQGGIRLQEARLILPWLQRIDGRSFYELYSSTQFDSFRSSMRTIINETSRLNYPELELKTIVDEYLADIVYNMQNSNKSRQKDKIWGAWQDIVIGAVGGTLVGLANPSWSDPTGKVLGGAVIGAGAKILLDWLADRHSNRGNAVLRGIYSKMLFKENCI
ncbi:hypothetical protein Dcar01_03706 [Deinococcus carri]|uniref:Uncharacterized protein n=1 Tax=Deinococcus carri TaxID=1211323 RepID=A0ABP9WFB0_9DEIO